IRARASPRFPRSAARTLRGVNDEEFDPGRLARAFETFLERFREPLPPSGGTLRRLVTEHLGRDPAELPVFTARFHASEQANLQLALDALVAESPGWRLLGLPAELRH